MNYSMKMCWFGIKSIKTLSVQKESAKKNCRSRIMIPKFSEIDKRAGLNKGVKVGIFLYP